MQSNSQGYTSHRALFNESRDFASSLMQQINNEETRKEIDTVILKHVQNYLLEKTVQWLQWMCNLEKSRATIFSRHPEPASQRQQISCKIELQNY